MYEQIIRSFNRKGWNCYPVQRGRTIYSDQFLTTLHLGQKYIVLPLIEDPDDHELMYRVSDEMLERGERPLISIRGHPIPIATFTITPDQVVLDFPSPFSLSFSQFASSLETLVDVTVN